MGDKEIIQAILAKCPEVTEPQVLAELEAKRSKTGNLITDGTLLRLIAVQHGVEITREPVSDCKLLNTHLIPNLNRITVSGRVAAVFPVKTFEGDKPGKYASLLITDKTGVLRVMLWNGKADLVESGTVKVGQVVRFFRAYTKEDRNGKTELHISEKGGFEVNPEGLEEDYPAIDRFATVIKDVTLQQGSVHLVGRVTVASASSTFTRQDNSVGTVLRFTMADKTGVIDVVAWNGKAESLEASLKADAEIKLVNAKVKPASNGGLEVHVDESTYVEVSVAAGQL